jgi:glycosyltransferase involved in cell wall biosynthesis
MNRRPQIALDARGVLRLPRGMPQYVSRLATLLPTMAPDLDFLLFVNRRDPYVESGIDVDARLRQYAEPPNVRMIEVTTDGEMWCEQAVLPREIRRARADLLHMPTNRVALFSPVPQIVTLHDAMEWKYLSRLVSIPRGASVRMKTWVWRRRAYVYMNYMAAAKRSTAVITDSRASADEIERCLRVKPTAVRTIHLGVDEDFTPGADPRLELPSRREHCLMFGGDVFQKNPEGNVRLWASLPLELRRRFPLLIVGFAGSDDSPLIRAIRESGSESTVRITRWIPRQQLIESMQKAAVLLFLSREEGFGLPVLQAMACGTPVAVSTAPAITEVAGNAAAVFADAEHPERAGDALATILSDDRMWAERRAIGLRRAAEFTWERCVAQHIDVYRACLSR